ncbi:MAG TPA: hypothetical protein VJZ51_04050 [Bacilli bacterium]|nr:hypothetical protein [Bacilli bacterium]
MTDTKWLAIYEEFITKLKETRPNGPYNKLDISKHYTNESVGMYGWRYSRHHIDEINISGATLKDMPEFKTGDSIIVDFNERFLLHYMIVLAGNTMPNHGMVTPLIKSGLTSAEAIKKWDELVVEACKTYNIEYVPGWTKKLTIFHRGTSN